jgi:hypothetical protein
MFETERLRNDVLQSWQWCSSHIPEPLKVENAQLQDELRDVWEEQIQLRHYMKHLWLECDHLAEKLEFVKDKGSRPYPRPSYSKRDMNLDTSSESLMGENRSREQTSAKRKEYVFSYSSRSTNSTSNNTPLGIPRFSSNPGIPHQDVGMEDEDNSCTPPSMSTFRPLGPSMAKHHASPSKPKWNMVQGYEDFFNEEDSESDDNLKIEDGFDNREHLHMTQAIHKAAWDKGKGKEIPPAMSYNSHELIHRKWASRRIFSLENTHALEDSMRKKDQHALGYLSYINSIGQVSTNPWSVEYLTRVLPRSPTKGIWPRVSVMNIHSFPSSLRDYSCIDHMIDIT